MIKTKKKKYVKALFLITFIGVAGVSTYFLQYHYPVFFEERSPKHFFWVYPRDLGYASNIIVNHSDKVDFVSPTLYGLYENGSLGSGWLGEDNNSGILQNFTILCKSHSIEVHPMIGTGSSDYARLLLENSTKIANFVAYLQSEIIIYGFNGINIDFEHLDYDLEDDYLNFLRILKQKLGPDIILSVDLHAFTKEITGTGWGAFLNYKEIGKIVDYAMLMTYDYHYGGSGPGEIGPISWVNDVFKYANSQIPVEKLYMGIPRYGYDWSNDSNWQNWGFAHSHFENKYEKFGGNRTRTDDGYELKYEYIDENGNYHIGYCPDKESTLKKQEFLSQYPVGGYCYWHMSSGDSNYW
jgi:spore germination protein YaaH